MSPGSAAGLILIAWLSIGAKAGAETAREAAGQEVVPLPIARPVEPPRAGTAAQGRERPTAAGQATKGRANYRMLLEREAKLNGLPPDIADAVTVIESGYDPSAIGGVGEIGLMQVRPETAAMLGFTGSPGELAKPDVNIRYGVTYLAQAWRLTNGDLCRTLMKYRAGHGEEVMSPLSQTYCGRARAYLASIGSPFAERVPAPLVFDPVQPRARVARRGPPRIRTVAVSQAFWAAHEARVRAITQRLEAKWRRMASR